MKAKLIYVTTSSREEAEQIAETVVTEKRAACANIFENMTSVYEWNGTLCREQETVLILKTTVAQVDALTARTKALHSYECPCIITLPVESGNPDFLDWISRQTGGQNK